MDRGGNEGADRPGGLALRNKLHVNHETRRPLFSNNDHRTLGKDVQSGTASVSTGVRPGGPGGLGAVGPTGLMRRAKSDPQSTASSHRKPQVNVDPNASSASILSPGGSRIPRPNISGLQHRRPISLAEAFKLAQEEEEEAERERQQGGSPSPAPRTWRARPGQPQDDLRARELMAEDPLDRKGQNRQYTEGEASKPRSANAEAKAPEPEPDTFKRVGNGPSLQERINEWRTRSRPDSNWAEKIPDQLRDASGEAHLPELVPGIEDAPFPSVESPERNAAFTSPSKDFTWQVDQDFTAGDLQVSDSPRIRVGINSNKPFANRPSIVTRSDIRSPGRINSPATRNTALEEIRAREFNLAGDSLIGQSTLTPQQPRRYTKLEEIRAREAAAQKQIPVPDRNQLRPKNAKIDEIRQRETEGLTRRAIATARLEEIKEQNAMTRSRSPEKGRLQLSRDAAPEMRPPVRPKPALEVEGERIPDTPVTIFKSYRAQQENIPPSEVEPSRGKDVAAVKPEVNERDLLRRLARATSSSPAPEAVNRRAPHAEEQQPIGSDKAVTRPILAGRSTKNGLKSAFNSHKDAESFRPTVGFAGLKRTPSTESAKSKRSSMQSESDPTARIEAEMKLFAPRDDYSEPGSVRAPSPEPDSDEEQPELPEATPKPQKHDFLHMETPRVTGAYVETPVTVKVEKVKEEEEPEPIKPLKARLMEQRPAAPMPDTAAILRDKNPSLAWRNKDEDTASEPASTARDSAAAPVAEKKPRSRSLPRRRPPLKNSAKPPSVKDDLRELQRQHNIDDSTVDDLEDILTGRKHASPRLKQLLQELPVKAEDEIDDEVRAVEKEIQTVKQEESDDRDMSAGEMALYDKMSKTLRTGLSSIRTAKLGIQRLEDQVAHAEKQSSTAPDDLKMKASKAQQHQPIGGQKVSPAEQRPPRLPSRGPTSINSLRFLTTRLSLVSLVVAVCSFWFAAELAVCQKYCRPEACTSTPCVYSYDDPTFGYALPVKLDQWTTGGHGRKLGTWVFEQLQDWAADIEDAVSGRSLEDISVDELDAAKRRQHRRRLQKRGLLKPLTKAGPDQTAKWDAWRRSRQAKERSRDVADMGYDAGGGWKEDTIGGDERVW